MAEHLDADVEGYLQAASANVAPPAVVSDPLITGATPVEELLRVLGLAANSSDLQDGTDSAGLHAQRDDWTTEAAGSFSGQDAASAVQVASSIAGALGGAITGLLQPLVALPQQFAQGALQAFPKPDPSPLTDGGADTGDQSVPEPFDAGDVGDVGDPLPAGVTPTVAAAAPGPPPPASSATYPSASVAAPMARAATGPSVSAPAPVMTGMPMVPPAGLPANGTEARGGSPVDTRKVTGPVRKATAVQDRLTGPVVRRHA